jgi:ABC-type multidrug transport system fused ATPase/permease subunit
VLSIRYYQSTAQEALMNDVSNSKASRWGNYLFFGAVYIAEYALILVTLLSTALFGTAWWLGWMTFSHAAMLGVIVFLLGWCNKQNRAIKALKTERGLLELWLKEASDALGELRNEQNLTSELGPL